MAACALSAASWDPLPVAADVGAPSYRDGMTAPPDITAITLGVRDVERSRALYVDASASAPCCTSPARSASSSARRPAPGRSGTSPRCRGEYGDVAHGPAAPPMSRGHNVGAAEDVERLYAAALLPARSSVAVPTSASGVGERVRADPERFRWDSSTTRTSASTRRHGPPRPGLDEPGPPRVVRSLVSNNAPQQRDLAVVEQGQRSLQVGVVLWAARGVPCGPARARPEVAHAVTLPRSVLDGEHERRVALELLPAPVEVRVEQDLPAPRGEGMRADPDLAGVLGHVPSGGRWSRPGVAGRPQVPVGLEVCARIAPASRRARRHRCPRGLGRPR